jgi:hypothetical protein
LVTTILIGHVSHTLDFIGEKLLWRLYLRCIRIENTEARFIKFLPNVFRRVHRTAKIFTRWYTFWGFIVFLFTSLLKIFNWGSFFSPLSPYSCVHLWFRK